MIPEVLASATLAGFRLEASELIIKAVTLGPLVRVIRTGIVAMLIIAAAIRVHAFPYSSKNSDVLEILGPTIMH
tara:strand:- start:38691 stop:38912 length:222 start_codon:yes stop_codon:yes gene_type:complete